MIRRITTTEAADADIRDIATYIAYDNEHASRKFGAELWESFQRIAENPEIGHIVAEFSELRVLRVSNRFRRYLVFYRSLGTETVEVVRVLHGARDITLLVRDIA